MTPWCGVVHPLRERIVALVWRDPEAFLDATEPTLLEAMRSAARACLAERGGNVYARG